MTSGTVWLGASAHLNKKDSERNWRKSRASAVYMCVCVCFSADLDVIHEVVYDFTWPLR